MRKSAKNSENTQHLHDNLEQFVTSLLVDLDDGLNRRLVRTFLRALQAIITVRHSRYGLLLSELGGYILSPAQAPAGTKRLSSL